MVTHVSDASFAPQDPQKDDLADQVLAKLQDEGVNKAYVFLKTSAQNVFSGRDENMDGIIDTRDAKTDVPMNSKEKEAFWNSLVKEMEAKRPGVTEQLSSVWLRDFKTASSKEAPLPVQDVRDTANGGLLMNKTFATEVMKDVDVIKNLWNKDEKIDDVEIERNVKRQTQEPREQFVQNQVEAAIAEAATNPYAAVNNLYAALDKRADTESQEEKNTTYEAVAKALSGHPDLIAKLATAYVHTRFNSVDKNNDHSKSDGRISADEIADYNPESVAKLFMNYISANFKEMSETSMTDGSHLNFTTLTSDELTNHMNRLKRDSRKSGK